MSPRAAFKVGPRPAAIIAVAGWSLLCAALAGWAAVVMVVSVWQPVVAMDNRFALRGVVSLGMAMVGLGALLGFGALGLWRRGQRGRLVGAFGVVLAVAALGAVDSVVEGDGISALVAIGTAAVAAVPLALLRLPSARRWVVTAPPAPDVPTEWQGRLNPVAARHLAHWGIANLGIFVFVLVTVVSGAVNLVDGTAGGWVLVGVGVVGLTTSAVLSWRALQATRDAVAAQHGLPQGSCRWVTFTDPTGFDATLAGAIKHAHHTG